MDYKSGEKSKNCFSDEEIKNISVLTDTLQKIRGRLISEGVIDKKAKEVLQKITS